MIVCSSVVAKLESVPVNPCSPIQPAGSAQFFAVFTGPVTSWRPGWQDRLTTLPTSPVAQLLGKKGYHPVDMLFLGSGGQE